MSRDESKLLLPSEDRVNSPTEKEGAHHRHHTVEPTFSDEELRRTQIMLATVCTGPVMGTICSKGSVGHDACWLCNSTDQPETIFQPCLCPTVCHRHCFRKWRQGWINPRNYFCCPNCMHSYNIERIKATGKTEQEIIRQFRVQLIKLWIGTFFMVGVVIAVLAGISYGCDTGDKNVPVACKYMMTSVISGLPSKNATTLWRQEFKLPEYHVWPYYTLFGTLIASILVLILFAMAGCTFDKNERRSRRCCQDCEGCCQNVYCYCYDPCPNTACFNCGNCTGCNGGCDCKCSGGGGGGGGGAEALIILALVVVVIVVVSAVFVVIFFALQRSTLLYDRMTHMLLSQQEELEGETIVLGISETWRPTDAV